MRFSLFLSFLAVFCAYAMATASFKQVVISFSGETPWRVVDDAIAAIEEAGGIITHKYTIIKGFAAKAPATILDKVQALNTQFPAIIEEDGIVSTNDEGVMSAI